MTRPLAALSFFFAACLSASATTITNGIVSVTWNPEQKTVVLSDQSGTFAKIALPNAHSANAHSATADDAGQPGKGGVLVVQRDTGEIEIVFGVGEQSPFVDICLLLNEDMFKDGHIKTLEYPKIELQIPADEIVTLGTAGLRAIDGHRGSYMFLAAANPKDRSGVVTGWISSDEGSGIVFSEKDANGRAVIKPVIQYGKFVLPEEFFLVSGEIFVIGRFDDCRIGLESYAEEIAEYNEIKIKDIPAGYCTWYAESPYGGAGNERYIITLTDAAAEKLAPFGFNFVQIDDRWQDGQRLNGPARGFLRVNPRGPYPNGMKAPADHIRSKNMMAGIWLLPFSGTPEENDVDHSLYAKSGVDEPTDNQGRNTRFSFKSFALKEGEPYRSRWTGATLDMTNPAAREYLHKIVSQMANDWNYNYFKLDGFNAALGVENIYNTANGEYREDYFGETVYHNPEITPVAAHRLGLETVREAAGEEAFILGCNVSQNMRSMGASFGLVDAMRIGPDNGASWSSLKRGPWHGTNRYFFNGRVWWNDPDPVYVKDSMPLEHAKLIATWVAVSGQLYVFSDWLPNLSEERLDILRRTMRPHGLTSARPVDLFSKDFPEIWHLTDSSGRNIVAFYNWDERNPLKIESTPQWIGLPEAEEYVAFDYWGNKFFGSFSDKLSVEVPGGSCLVLAVQPVKEHPILLSTSQHVTQGIVDVVSVDWNVETKTLSGVSKVIANDPYELRIYDPATKAIRRVMFEPKESSDSFEWSAAQ